MKTERIIKLIEKRIEQKEKELRFYAFNQSWAAANDLDTEIKTMKDVLFDIYNLQTKRKTKREKAEALARESASQIDPNYRHPNFGAMNYDLTSHLTAQYQDEKGEWHNLMGDDMPVEIVTGHDASNGKDYGASVEMKKEGDTFAVTKIDLVEPTRHAAELETIAQTHQVLTQTLPVEPDTDTLDFGFLEWKRQQAEEAAGVIIGTIFSDEIPTPEARQHWERQNKKAVMDRIFNALPGGEKLTVIKCFNSDCYNVVIDTPSSLRKNNRFVFVHGYGWHCPSCALKVGNS